MKAKAILERGIANSMSMAKRLEVQCEGKVIRECFAHKLHFPGEPSFIEIAWDGDGPPTSGICERCAPLERKRAGLPEE